MKLSDSLYKEIGNIKEDVLMKALAIMLVKYLSKEKEEDEDYDINDAFNDSFKGSKIKVRKSPTVFPLPM